MWLRMLAISTSTIHLDSKSMFPWTRRHKTFVSPPHCPLHLADWLMRDSTTNIRENVDDRTLTALTAVLGARLSAVDRILDLQGIVRVDIPNQDAQEEPGRPDAHNLNAHGEDDAASERPRTRDSAIPSTNSASITPATISHETATGYIEDDESNAASEQGSDPYPDADNL